MTGQPETVAGRMAKQHAERRVWPSQRNDPNAGPDGYIHYCANLCEPRKYPCDTLLALAAARAEAFAEIRRGVEGLEWVRISDLDGERWPKATQPLVNRDRVLALLPSVPPEDRG